MYNRRDEAHAKAVEGHNLLITGQCGTGKTYWLKYESNFYTNPRKSIIDMAINFGAFSEYSSHLLIKS